MATTGPAVVTGPTVVTNTSAVTGQGSLPLLWVLYSTDDVTDTDPLWIDATSKVRSYSKVVGRDSEQGEIDTGKATIELDNRDRTFDWVNNALIRPNNRWKILSQFSGSTESRFVGYADSYTQSWPGKGADALTVVNLSDELKMLALKKLPTMNPPRDTYEDLVMSDKPAGYWRWNNPNLAGTVGETWIYSAYSLPGDTPIVGDYVGHDSYDSGVSLRVPVGSTLTINPEAFNTQGAAAVTVEFWYRFSVLPAAQRDFFAGAMSAAGATRILYFSLSTAGQVLFNARNSTPTLFTATSAPLTPNTWYHIVGTIDGSFIRVYVNGQQSGSTAWSGVLVGGGGLATNPPFLSSVTDTVHDFDEIAFYPARDLGATRVLAHYAAGTQRGFPDSQLPGARANAILDSAGSVAPRSIQPGTRTMQGAFMKGQDALGELRKAQRAESVDAVLFASRAGVVTFLADGHRNAAPYNTVQATFDDDGTDFPYLDLTLDISEQFLANVWNVTRSGGITQTASDAASIAANFDHAQSLTDVPVTTDAHAASIATAMLAKYKDPLTRIPPLELTTTIPDVAEAILARDIGDRIRVLRTPVGGGTRHDLTLFIQKIEETAGQGSTPWHIRWTVTPV
jgi:hypothetical protein